MRTRVRGVPVDHRASLKKCPKCGKLKLKRLIGTGAGVIFKGSGFYETDYRSDNYKKSAKAESDKQSPPKTDTAAAASAKSEGGAAKSESTSSKSDTGTTKSEI